MIGKPYSGKPNVRFDEGELEIELLATTPALYSSESDNPFLTSSFLKCSKSKFARELKISPDISSLGKVQVAASCPLL